MVTIVARRWGVVETGRGSFKTTSIGWRLATGVWKWSAGGGIRVPRRLLGSGLSEEVGHQCHQGIKLLTVPPQTLPPP